MQCNGKFENKSSCSVQLGKEQRVGWFVAQRHHLRGVDPDGDDAISKDTEVDKFELYDLVETFEDWYISDLTTSSSISPSRQYKYFLRSRPQCSKMRVSSTRYT